MVSQNMGPPAAKRPRLGGRKGDGTSTIGAVATTSRSAIGHDGCAHVWQEAGDGQPGRVCNQCGLYNPQTELRGDEELFNENFAQRSKIDYTDPASEVRAMTRHAASIRGKFNAKEGLTTDEMRAIRTADALVSTTSSFSCFTSSIAEIILVLCPVLSESFDHQDHKATRRPRSACKARHTHRQGSLRSEQKQSARRKEAVQTCSAVFAIQRKRRDHSGARAIPRSGERPMGHSS